MCLVAAGRLAAEVQQRRRRKSTSGDGSSHCGTIATRAKGGETAELVASRLDRQSDFPFFPRPFYRQLDITDLPGDSGFDPLGVIKSERDLWRMREAELKHGRLAVLAMAGWTLSELLHPIIANMFGMENKLVEGVFAPTIFNTGLNDLNTSQFVIYAMEAIAIMEILGPKDGQGDYGWNPFGLKDWAPPKIRGVSTFNKPWMPEAEIKHCRLAMLGFSFALFEEMISGVPFAKLITGSY